MGRPVEPIAVVGMACRLPQAENLDAYWRLLRDGTDAITEATAERWPRTVLPDFRRAGFLESVDTFDAGLFGIDPAEARAMDPQQRLMLELSWHALEDARLTTARIEGGWVGAFAAAINHDYALAAEHTATPSLDRHTYAGSQQSMLANRLSYLLGLRGPSLTVDTGQSSSLVAVHLACESLRSSECDLAFVGGANLMLRAETTASIAEFGALSPDGVCRVFDHRANGYVRGEGGAVVILKRLSDAVAAGDPIRCTLLGSAVNNDGGGETLTAPTVRAQREVIESAHRRACVQPQDVGYVELHGTATRVGDPVEARALGDALGGARDSTPVKVGSVKTNIGHLEAVAGLAGLVKTALSIEHATFVPTLNFSEPNPAIDLEGLGLEVVDTVGEWTSDERRVAGVSSFGMGGTNCHVVLGDAPSREHAQDDQPQRATTLPWVISAASPTALRETARAIADHATETDHDEVALALGRSRSLLRHRAVCLGNRLDAARAVADGQFSSDAVIGRNHGAACAFVFPGQGSQWRSMARDLIVESAPFAGSLARCAEALEPFVDYSIHDVLWDRPGAASFDRVDVVQPALWAMMVALAEQWMNAGVRPDAVIGHSQGEIAGATVAGALSLSDGARVVALRSRALAELAGTGGMLSVQASVDVVEDAIAQHAPGATVAAVNSPGALVVSGTNDELNELHGQLTVSGCRARLVPVDYASHSPAVEDLRTQIMSALSPVAPQHTDVTVISSVTGAVMDPRAMDAEYWYDGLRKRVDFAPAIDAALGMGIGVFVESSAHPVISSAIEETIETAGADAVALPTLRRDTGGLAQLRRAFALGHASGLTIAWGGGEGPTADLVPLPSYPLQRRRYWLGEEKPVASASDDGSGQPLTRAEALDLVREVTCGVVGRDDIAVVSETESFRDIGVDSVNALEIRSQLRQLTGKRLSAGVLFERPTPGMLADLLSAPDDDRVDVTANATDDKRDKNSSESVHDDEPIAIVGMACRLPGGVSTPGELWELVRRGQDAIGAFPTDRDWDIDRLLAAGADTTSASSTHSGGFLDDIAGFDAAFFGISPREAKAMDPQQRFVLSTAWEALENGGFEPASLEGTSTGVFVGGMPTDYGPPLHSPTPDVDGHLLTGTALSVCAGRVAYTLGLNGPALTVDTACSSSLVAIHLAMRALRAGECSLALAGGVTLMATPGMFVEFSRQGGLSPDGRCKAFGAAADGTGWAEGAGMIVLQPLSEAQLGGHPILGVLRGSAMNQDGRSNGLTAPNGIAQEKVITAALADAGLDPSDIDAVEAHGTGTTLGDPIEAQALVNTYGAAHDDEHPLWLGSIKSNIGHTQAAAGVASVIKTVQALRHGILPQTLHADEPTPLIDWPASGMRLLSEPVTIDRDPAHTPARVGISGFGISGTNAHVIVEQPAPTSPTDELEQQSSPIVWAFSARTGSALSEYATRLGAHAAEVTDLHAAGRALGARSRFDHRAVVVAADRAELVSALDAVAQGTSHAAAMTGMASADAECVFVFPGQGTQWVGMARELMAENDLFWEAMCECDGAFATHIDWSILDVIHCEPDAPALEGPEVIQPVLFSVMVALARTWRASGVEPSVVLGHSQGEIAAAHVAGAVCLDDAARLVVRRSRALALLGDAGGMVSVAAPAANTEQLIEPWSDRLSVAIHSSPSSTVVGGDRDALAEFRASCEDSAQVRPVAIEYAAHTSQIEQIESQLRAAAEGVEPLPSEVRIGSSLVGDFIEANELGPDFWYRGLRKPVFFTQAVEQVATALRHPLFVEVSPHPALIAHVDDTLYEARIEAGTVPSLRRHHGGWAQFLHSLGAAFVAGAVVDWSAVIGREAIDVDVPTYPFESRRFWISSVAVELPSGVHAVPHSLIDAVLPTHDGGFVLTGSVSGNSPSWLADHVVADATLVPGTAFLELANAAARVGECDEIEDLTIVVPMSLPSAGSVSVQVTLGPPEPDGRRPVAIYARSSGQDEWVRCADGVCRASSHDLSAAVGVPLPERAAEIDVDDVYRDLRQLGYTYGLQFQGLRRAWRDADGWSVEVSLPDAVDTGDFVLHPALLDASLHAVVLDRAGDEMLLPYEWRGVRIWLSNARTVRVRITMSDPDRLALSMVDEVGRPVATVEELVLRRLPRHELPGGAAPEAVDGGQPSARVGSSGEPGLTEVTWEPLTVTSADVADVSWALVSDDLELVTSLTSAGITVRQAFDLPSLADQIVDDAPRVIAVTLASENTGDVGSDARVAAVDALAAVQTFLADERFDASQLLLLTDGTVPSAAIWGLARVAQAEHPNRIAVAALEPTTTDWAEVAGAMAAGESQLRTVDGRLSAPRLVPVPTTDAATVDFDPDKTVVITGGTGGLGALVASHLVETHGIRHLLLVSKSGVRAAGADALIEHLGNLGATVTVAAADVSIRRSLSRALDQVDAVHPIGAVVHAAGLTEDGPVEHLSMAQFDDVMAAKVDGAVNLRDLTREFGVDTIVMFSSVAGVIGALGQANYAAANALLDELANDWRAGGVPATSISWGLWGHETAMTAGLTETDRHRIARRGVGELPAEAALKLFDQAIARGQPHVVASSWVTDGLDALASPLLSSVGGMPKDRGPGRQQGTTAAQSRLNGRQSSDIDSEPRPWATMPPAAARQAILDLVRADVATALGYAGAHEISPDHEFADLGLDSLTVVELRNRLQGSTGLRLPATLAFDHPTVAALVDHLASELIPEPESPQQRLRDVLNESREFAAINSMHREELVALLRNTLRGLEESDHSTTRVADDISSASDHELFEFLDNS